jgi:galactokinase
MDSAAIILAVPAALWALAWWDVQRRKSTHSAAIGEACRRLNVLEAENEKASAAVHALAKTVGAIERDHKELSAIVSNNRPKLSKFQRGG